MKLTGKIQGHINLHTFKESRCDWETLTMTDYKGKVEQDSRTEKGSNSTMREVKDFG